MKSVSTNRNTNNSGGQTKGKHGRHFKNKVMKMKTAEYIELNRSQSMTKRKRKKGDTNMISAANKRGKAMTMINTEAHQEWKPRVRKSSKMTMTDIDHHEWKRGISESSKMTTTDVAHHEWKRGVWVIEGSQTCKTEFQLSTSDASLAVYVLEMCASGRIWEEWFRVVTYRRHYERETCSGRPCRPDQGRTLLVL